MSDTHVSPRAPAFNTNLKVAMEWIRARAPGLVVHLGDITADGVTDAAEFALARKLLSNATVAAPAPGLEIRCIPGNHDIGDNPAAPGRATEHPVSLERLAEFRETLGPDWWSRDHQGWRLIGLNAMLFGTGLTEEERQFEWLASMVAGTSKTILFLHKPLFRDGPADTEVHDRYVPVAARRRLLSLLHGHDLRMVLSGHVHQARRLDVDSVGHVWVPSTSFCIPDAVQETIGDKVVGLGVLDLQTDDCRFSFVTPPGLVRHNLLDHEEVYPQIAAIKARLPPVAGDV